MAFVAVVDWTIISPDAREFTNGEVAMSDAGKTKDSQPPGWAAVMLGAFELIKASAWTLLAGVVIIWLHRPLGEAVDQLPDLIGRAHVLSVAELKIEVGDAIGINAPPALRTALLGARGDAITRLVQISQLTRFCPQEHYMDEFRANRSADLDLEYRKLFLIREVPTGEYGAVAGCYDVSTTELGQRTRDVLLKAPGKDLHIRRPPATPSATQ